MARGNESAQSAAKLGVGGAQTYQGQSGQAFGTLAPALTRDISAPVGFNDQEKATMRTAAAQSGGGSNAGVVGQAGLMAARTRNAGGADAAIQESARESGRQASEAAVGIEVQDAALKQQKAGEAKRAFGQLYGISTGGGNQALGNVASNINADTNAEQASWNWTVPFGQVLGAAGQASSGGLRRH